MTDQSNMEHTKDKKKSLLERIFTSFANQTRKFKKPSSKRKLKMSIERNSILPLRIESDAIESVTFCDYCDREIFAKFTGQDIICHDFCKPSTDEVVMRSEIDSYLGSSTLTSSTEYRSNAGMSNLLAPRLSSSVRDLTISYSPNDDDSPTLNSGSSISSYHYNQRTSMSTIRNNYPLTTNIDSYTFSTVDVSTVKQYGISIRKTPSSNQNVIDNPPRNEKEVIPKSGDTFDNQTIPCDLQSLIEMFNDNEEGLFFEYDNDQLMGKIRLYINLLRPVLMLFTARPPSIFDTLVSSEKEGSTISRHYYNRPVLLWLPRGSTKMLYANINCSTNDLISMLLTKFNIQNNPKKYALYEHTIISSTEVEVRKFKSYHCPLKVMISWCTMGKVEFEENLMKKRFVLQENDPGSVEWNDFSIPELQSFLRILTQEEQDKRKQICLRFHILKSEIQRHQQIRTVSEA